MQSLIRLGVNIDHVATIRQARGGAYPDPLQAAFIAADHGADGITMHLREDRRHIQDLDVERVRAHVMCRLNLEMAATAEMVDIALRIRPDDCCLVPERRAELTTEGGLDVAGREEELREICSRLGEAGVRTALFTDAQDKEIAAAASIGAHAVELHTGPYADATTDRARAVEFDKLEHAARCAREAGLIVNAGHGLDYHNVEPVAAIQGIHELNIGHAIVGRAVMTGMADAVMTMKTLIREAARVGA